MSQFRAKKSFSKRNFIKKTLEWVPRTKYTRFRVPFGMKTFHFRAKKSFFHFFRSFFHHCLLILPYHFAKFLKKIFRVDSNKKSVPGFGHIFFQDNHYCHLCFIRPIIVNFSFMVISC